MFVYQSRLFASSLVLVMWTSFDTGRLAAQNNGGPPGDVNQTFVINPGGPFGSCAFPISISVQGKGKVINLTGGRFIVISPQLNATVTNLADPSKQLQNINITGASHVTTGPDGSQVFLITGRNLNVDPVAGVVLAIGRFSFVLDAAMNPIQLLSGKGQVIDLCALIE